MVALVETVEERRQSFRSSGEVVSSPEVGLQLMDSISEGPFWSDPMVLGIAG